MANIVIKKRVNLSFLGDEHKDDYLVFKSIPVKEYKDLEDKRPKDEGLGQVDFIIDVLKDKFIEGTFNKESVNVEDISDLDADTIITCFSRLVGQELDPKVDGQ